MKDHLGNKIKRKQRVLIAFDEAKVEFTLGQFYIEEFKKTKENKTVLVKQLFNHPTNGIIESFFEKDPTELIGI